MAMAIGMMTPALLRRTSPTFGPSSLKPSVLPGLEGGKKEARTSRQQPKHLQVNYTRIREDYVGTVRGGEERLLDHVQGVLPQHSARCRNTTTPIRQQEPGRSRVVVRAIPVAVSGVLTLAVVGAAVVAIARKEKLPILSDNMRKECEDCKGSGLCPACNGEGFLLKNLSKEAAAKARANAKDAATRYTAGLAKKWSYCGTCSGGRGCPTCEGRGWLKEERVDTP